MSSTAYIGRLKWYWIWKESVRWTAVAPTFWIQQNEADFDNTVEKIIDESAVWVLMNSSESNNIKQYATWNINWILPSNWIWLFLLSLLWSVSSAPTSWGGWAYEHDFSMNNINSKQSLTVALKTPIEELRYALAMIWSMVISANMWEAVMFKALLRAKFWTTSSLTKAYVEDNKFYSHNVTIKIADDLAWLDAALGECIETFELSLTQELEDWFCFKSWRDLDDIHNKAFSIDLTLWKIMRNTTYQEYVEDTPEVYKAMRIEMTDTSKTIWTSDNPTIQIDIAKVSFDKHEPEGPIDDVERESLTCKGHYDLANSDDLTIKVINTTTSY